MLRIAGMRATLPLQGRVRNRERGFDCFLPRLNGDAPVTLPWRGRVDANEMSSGVG
jgi:hypothetical protein